MEEQQDQLTLDAYLSTLTPVDIALADKPVIRLEFDAAVYTGGLYVGVKTSLEQAGDDEAAQAAVFAKAVAHVARRWPFAEALTEANLARLGLLWNLTAWNGIVRSMFPKAPNSANSPSGSTPNTVEN